jgi:hypothetical protein
MSTYKVSASDDAALELGAANTVKSVMQNIKIIITTRKGTVPTYRDFGVDMDFLDLPLPGAEQRARVAIREAVEQWEPRATVTGITFGRDGASGRLIPTVEVEINDEQGTVRIYSHGPGRDRPMADRSV